MRTKSMSSSPGAVFGHGFGLKSAHHLGISSANMNMSIGVGDVPIPDNPAAAASASGPSNHGL